MPEIGILLTRDEEQTVIRSILDRAGWLVPDFQYEVPVPALVKTHEDYLRWRSKTRLFFVLHDSFLVVPLELRQVGRDGGLGYFIAQRTGGPTIEFLSTLEFQEDARRWVNPGFIAHHRTFWDAESRANVKPPQAFVTFFKETIAIMKQVAALKKIGVRRYWIGNEMSVLLENGTMHLGIQRERR